MRRNTIAVTDCLLKLLTRASGCSLSDPILRRIDNEHRLVAEWPVSLASQAFEHGFDWHAAATLQTVLRDNQDEAMRAMRPCSELSQKLRVYSTNTNSSYAAER